MPSLSRKIAETCLATTTSVGIAAAITATGAAVLNAAGYEGHSAKASTQTMAIGMALWSGVGTFFCGCSFCGENMPSITRVVKFGSYLVSGIFFGSLVGSAASQAAGLATESFGKMIADAGTGMGVIGGGILAGAGVNFLALSCCAMLCSYADRHQRRVYGEEWVDAPFQAQAGADVAREEGQPEPIAIHDAQPPVDAVIPPGVVQSIAREPQQPEVIIYVLERAEGEPERPPFAGAPGGPGIFGLFDRSQQNPQTAIPDLAESSLTRTI